MTHAEIIAAAREIVAAQNDNNFERVDNRSWKYGLDMAIELLRLHDGGEWSSEPPTEPGDYFWRKTMSDKPRTRHVGVWPGDKSLVVGTDSNEERILFGGIATVAQIGGFWLRAEPATATVLAELRAENERLKIVRCLKCDLATIMPGGGVYCDECYSELRAERDRLAAELAEAKAALAEQVTHCGNCDGHGDIITNVRMNEKGELDCDNPTCHVCKPARDLLAKLGTRRS